MEQIISNIITKPIFLLKKNGEIVFVNHAGEDAYGMSSPPLLGRNITELQQGKSLPNCLPELAQVIESQEKITIEEQIDNTFLEYTFYPSLFLLACQTQRGIYYRSKGSCLGGQTDYYC